MNDIKQDITLLNDPRQDTIKELWDLINTDDKLRIRCHLHSFKKRSYKKTFCEFSHGVQFILIKYSWDYKDEYHMTRPRNLNYQKIEKLIEKLKAGERLDYNFFKSL